MSKLKLRLDIISLTPKQRRIFLKKFRNIRQMTNNLNLEVQNNIVSGSNGPGNTEQLSQQQNVLKEIYFDYSFLQLLQFYREKNNKVFDGGFNYFKDYYWECDKLVIFYGFKFSFFKSRG